MASAIRCDFPVRRVKQATLPAQNNVREIGS
jgi:hypothetical protein